MVIPSAFGETRGYRGTSLEGRFRGKALAGSGGFLISLIRMAYGMNTEFVIFSCLLMRRSSSVFVHLEDVMKILLPGTLISLEVSQ